MNKVIFINVESNFQQTNSSHVFNRMAKFFFGYNVEWDEKIKEDG
jgi:hypothetical protein